MPAPSVAFVVPAHGRVELARVCLRQLARTCDSLAEAGVAAIVVVAADDENLDTARGLGFETVEQANEPLGRKWNDGYEHAARCGADYVVALGSDDWLDAALIVAQLEMDGELRCSRLSTVVSEDGTRLAPLMIGYDGGDGVRMIPTSLLKPLGYRPAEEGWLRAIDTSILGRLTKGLGRQPRLSYCDLHPLQIVDFKSGTGQLNSYQACLDLQAGDEHTKPLQSLARYYPAAAISDLDVFYRRRAKVSGWC